MRILKRFTFSTLGLLILTAVMLGHGTSDNKLNDPLDTGSSLMLPIEIPLELPPASDEDGKKLAFAVCAATLVSLARLWLKRIPSFTVFSFHFAFLSMVFYQSNYVIKPL